MAYPNENAKAICLSTYHLFYELLGIDSQKKDFERIENKNVSSSQTVTIEDTFHIRDAFSTIKIKVTNDGKWNYIKITLPGREFKSFEIENDYKEIAQKFDELVSPKLEPMLDHVKGLIQ